MSNSTNLTTSYTENDLYLIQILKGFSEPDLDLAGLGSMIGFLSAGALAQVFSLILHRLKDCRTHTLRPNGAITKTHVTYRIAKVLSPSVVDDPLHFWINLISSFLIGLSDQQLVMGLLVLAIITGTKGASFSMLFAQYISFFTLLTHAATFSSMRHFFRIYRRLTSIRVMVMLAAYCLWMAVNVAMFQIMRQIMHLPGLPDDTIGELDETMQSMITIFGVEAGVMTWVYLGMIPSLFMSDELIEVRKVIAKWPMRSEVLDTSAISNWIEKLDTGSYKIRADGQTRRLFKISEILLAPFALFCRIFLRTSSKPGRTLLWFIAEIFFAWALVPLVLLIIFLALLVYLILVSDQYASRTEWNFGQIVTIAVVVLPLWSLIQNYAILEESALEEKRTSMSQEEHVMVDSKAWGGQPHSPGTFVSLDAGYGDIAEPIYRSGTKYKRGLA